MHCLLNCDSAALEAYVSSADVVMTWPQDLERLPPEEVARICEWVTEKVDSFASKLKPEAKDANTEVISCLTHHGLLSDIPWSVG